MRRCEKALRFPGLPALPGGQADSCLSRRWRVVAAQAGYQIVSITPGPHPVKDGTGNPRKEARVSAYLSRRAREGTTWRKHMERNCRPGGRAWMHYPAASEIPRHVPGKRPESEQAIGSPSIFHAVEKKRRMRVAVFGHCRNVGTSIPARIRKAMTANFHVETGRLTARTAGALQDAAPADGASYPDSRPCCARKFSAVPGWVNILWTKTASKRSAKDALRPSWARMLSIRRMKFWRCS